MISPEALQKIEEIATAITEQIGCRLYDVSYGTGEAGRALRVFIDKEVAGGATIDECAQVSRAINLFLDTEDVMPDEHFNLEVSTPGVERVLKKKWHFQGVVGKKIRLKLTQNLESLGFKGKSLGSKKQFSEILKSCNDTGVYFEIKKEETDKEEIEKEEIMVPFSAIEKANLVFEFGAEKGKKIKHNKE